MLPEVIIKGVILEHATNRTTSVAYKARKMFHFQVPVQLVFVEKMLLTEVTPGMPFVRFVVEIALDHMSKRREKRQDRK